MRSVRARGMRLEHKSASRVATSSARGGTRWRRRPSPIPRPAFFFSACVLRPGLPLPRFLLRYGLQEPARRAPKRCHVEHASALEAQSQPQAAYRIAFDPPALHAVRMPVCVVSDEPLFHARLALWAIASAIRHNTLPLLIRTVSAAGWRLRVSPLPHASARSTITPAQGSS